MKKKGISLIVLVITIIIVIILAAAVVITLSKNNPIQMANEAKFKTDVKSLNEELSLTHANKAIKNSNYDSSSINAEGYNELKEYIPDITKEYANVIKIEKGELIYKGNNSDQRQWSKDVGLELPTIKEYTVDGVPIPQGFYYVSGTKTTGTVISDVEGDDLANTNKGNQYVWVPVDYTTDEEFNTKFSRQDFTNTSYYSSLSEPATSGYTNEQAEYNAMVASVKQYHGFYIARFEAGDGNATANRTAPTNASNVVSKKGAYVYNFVPWGVSVSDPSEISGKSGAVYLSKNVASQNGYTSVVSTLVYGVQWDSTMRFVANTNPSYPTGAAGWNIYTDAFIPHKTGEDMDASASNSICNIYDLSGNLVEWTMESYGTSRIERGGMMSKTGNLNKAGQRTNGNGTASAGAAVTFRVALYIK